MPAYLLTWNPNRWQWDDLTTLTRALKRGESPIQRWSAGGGKQIRRGDRLFILRQGIEPKGILASGWAETDWYEAPHYDPDRAAATSRAQQAAAALAEQLTDNAHAFTGQAIAGQIASAISQASATRYQISNKAEQDYNCYASDLTTYRKTPRLLAATRLQETREKVMSDVLVQTIVGPITRINTNPDPEVAEELAEADLQRRREEARRKKEEQGR